MAAQWGKIVARRTFGEGGPGLEIDFATLEQLASAARGLTEGTLHAMLEQQRQTMPAEQACPDCGQPCPVAVEPRPMHGCDATITYREPVCHCPACRRDFFPLRPALGLDGHSYSPTLCERLVTLAGRLHSFEQAAIAIQVAGGVTISGRHIQRLTQEVGAALAAQRDGQAERYRRRTLPPRVPAPQVAVVEVDGGRLGTRQSAAGPGVHQPQPKEDKIACLVSMRSLVHDADPQPEPPAGFRDARRVARLVQQLHGTAASATENPTEMPATPLAAADEPAAPSKPQRLVRTCVASMCDSRAFAPLVAAEAQTRGFFETARQAFLGDGQRYNWWIQRAYFPDWVAIADFLHVLAYLYGAAFAMHRDAAGQWSQFEQWLRACWQGRVGEVIADLQRLQQCLAPPPGDAVADDPRQVVFTTLGYLCNNQTRMDYPRYRRMGLPVTSSLVESLVGEFNARVKGRDKWWNRPTDAAGMAGVEAILQVRAAVLSEDGRLRRYFAEKRGHAYRRHQPARRPRQTVAA